jgi:glycosyltransferase involved in cell wall biosynthesis
VILLLHHRYRVTGGEERAVADLQWLIRSQLGEDAEVLERDSSAIGGRPAARGLLRGGLTPEDVSAAVRATGARVVHAHNVQPTFGWRALAAAREAGARVVLHLHNYRLVCSNGVCFTNGEDCTRCHGRRTWPAVRFNCREGSRVEDALYATSLARWQEQLCAQVDRFLVPSAFALARLHELGAPVGDRAQVLWSVQREFAERSSAGAGGHVLYAGRLTEEKGVRDAIAACAREGLPLVVAGDGPLLEELRASAGGEVRFTGRVGAAQLAELRAGAAVAVVPSRYQEILPLAALEAMAAGLPVVSTASGGLTDFVDDTVPIGDVTALGAALRARFGDADAGERALARVRERCAPEVVADRLRAVYAG